MKEIALDEGEGKRQKSKVLQKTNTADDGEKKEEDKKDM